MEDYSRLDAIYSALLSVEDLIGEAEDYYFGDDEKIRTALYRCYSRVESALKSLSKYCEDQYL